MRRWRSHCSGKTTIPLPFILTPYRHPFHIPHPPSPSTSALLPNLLYPHPIIPLTSLSHTRPFQPQPQPHKLKKPLIPPTLSEFFFFNFLIFFLPQLTQNQLDALVSFAFNLGCGPIAKIANFINNSRYKAATDNMLLYVYGGGVVLPGLVRRRQAEVALFYTVWMGVG